VRAPTRALIVEDIEAWVVMLERAARRAGASEIIVCGTLDEVKDALRSARFDIAILDIGLDPDDDENADGVKALEMIRETDGMGTRCILVTGWQGDRMDLQAAAQKKHGVDWAYMKERYEQRAVIAKLTELLEQAPERRMSATPPMTNLRARITPFQFEDQLIRELSPTGGMPTLYSAAFRLLNSAIPLVARDPDKPMEKGSDRVTVGLYWSRALRTAVAVGLASVDSGHNDEAYVPVALKRALPAGFTADLLEFVHERNILGWLWEIPALERTAFVE
jgi:ActR/RegA family two-component response regulator